MSGGMPNSPGGHEIREADGQPSAIVERGKAITDLGTKMELAADTLQRIKENTFSGGAMAGEAIESLQETIGDCYKKLGEAADLYKPVGPVIETYGGVLETNKPLLDRSASNCRDLWATYESLPGDKDGSTEPDDGGGTQTPQEKQAAEDDAADNQAKRDAYDAWETEAESFDTWYSAWNDGYDEAVSGISDGLSGSIKDGFWDDIGPAVDFLKTIVDIAAIIVAVVALIAGGWILALAATLLALAALLLTFAQYKRGAATFSDLVWAGVGLVPFGKLSALSKLKGLRTIARNADELGKANKAFRAGVFKNFSNLRPKNLKAMEEGAFKFKEWKSIKKFGASSFPDTLKDYEKTLGRRLSGSDLESVAKYALTNQIAANAGNVMTHYGRYQTVSAKYDGGVLPDVPAIPKVPGINMPIGTVAS